MASTMAPSPAPSIPANELAALEAAELERSWRWSDALDGYGDGHPADTSAS